jgi:hypothetical protein
MATLAKKKAVAPSPSKSDVIREILKANSNATQKEVRAILNERGVKASDALISKIKYGRRSPRGKKRAKSSNGAVRGSKAAAIRRTFVQLGDDARPRDIIATLRKRGIKVSSAQVSTLRRTARGGSSGRAPSAHAVSLDHLVAAKQLVERVGGIEAARQALSSLSMLLDV